MIKKIRVKSKIFVPMCDCCGDELDIEWSYEDAVLSLRRAGWQAKKVDDEWVNYCPECQEMMQGAKQMD